MGTLLRAVSPRCVVVCLLQFAALGFAQETVPPSNAVEIADQPRAIDPATLLPKALAEPVTVDFNEVALSEVVEWLQKERKLGVVLDHAELAEQSVLPSEPISDKLIKAPLYLLLARLRTANIGWYQRDGLLHLTTREAAAAATSTVSYNVSDLFDAGYDSDRLIQTIAGVIDPPQWSEVGGEGDMEVLGDVLFVKQSSELHLQIAALLAALRKHARRTYIFDPPAHEPLRAALQKTVSVDFREIGLAAAVQQLAKQHEVDLRLDKASLQHAGVRDRQPVSLTLADQKLGVALEALLGKLKLTWCIRDGAVWVCSRDTAQDTQSVAVYDVRDLALDRSEAEALREAVQNQTGAAHWSDTGGPGQIELPLPGVMTVRQTEPLHDRLLALLENYRTALRSSKPRVKPQSDPKQVLTRYYRMPAAMAADMYLLLPQIVEPDSWSGADKPQAVGKIYKAASGTELQKAADAKKEADGFTQAYAVLVITQTRAVHDKLPELLWKVEHGEPATGGKPFATSVIPFGGGGFGGGGFGGGFFAVPAK